MHDQIHIIPNAVLNVLENDTTLTRLDTGASIDVTANWARVISETEHSVSLSLEPTTALAEGWYALTSAGSLDTMHGTAVRIPESAPDEHQSLFRVGSAPLVIENCSTGLTLRFFEPVTVPDVLPLAIDVTAGVVSPSAAPLRNTAGDSSFTITVPQVSAQCRTWRPTTPPTF